MTYSYFDYLGLFIASAFVVGFLTPRFRSMAIRMQIIDKPNSQHKTHIEPVPYLGGLAIIFGTLFISLPITFFVRLDLVETVFGILLPPLFLGIVGLVDDIVNLSPWPRFLAQSAAGVAVAITLILTETVGSPTGSDVLDVSITILFIVVLSNSINFFDNLDGGAAGAVAISTFFLTLFSFWTGQYLIAALSIVLSGATTGFLWWNKSPARIYMGDAGSLFLGSLLASLLVRFEVNSMTFPTNLFVVLFLVATPLLDTCLVVLSRVARRVSPFKGGRDHLSHRMMILGFSKVSTVLHLWMLSFVFCLVSSALLQVSPSLGSQIIFTAATGWSLLLFYFLKIPPHDKMK